MKRSLTLAVSIWLSLCAALKAEAGCNHYEPTRPPLISRSDHTHAALYIDFIARDEIDGYGHSFIVIGSRDTANKIVVAGFVPKGAEDDCLSVYAIPVRGMVGVSKSDFSGKHTRRFRVALTPSQFKRALQRIAWARRNWSTYALLARNCNTFTGLIAQSIGLRFPASDIQDSSTYISQLRSLNRLDR